MMSITGKALVPASAAFSPLGKDDVRALQMMLAEAGFDPGPIDGWMGRRTRRALVAALGLETRNLKPADAIAVLPARRPAEAERQGQGAAFV